MSSKTVQNFFGGTWKCLLQCFTYRFSIFCVILNIETLEYDDIQRISRNFETFHKYLAILKSKKCPIDQDIRIFEKNVLRISCTEFYFLSDPRKKKMVGNNFVFYATFMFLYLKKWYYIPYSDSVEFFWDIFFYIIDMRESSISPNELIFGDDDEKHSYSEYQSWKKNFATISIVDQDLKRFSVVGQTSPFFQFKAKNICISHICYQNCPKMIKYFLKNFSNWKSV